MQRTIQFSIFVCAIVTLLCGCVATGSNGDEASAEYLAPHGWQNPDRFNTHSSFNDYARAIHEEVRKHRVAFDPKNTEQEINMASPAEYLPAEKCGTSMRGIAILVHGLSDNAFSMHDIALVLADACYTSRTVLLPGHGTRAGDMLTTRLAHWNDTLAYLIDQAAVETDNIILVGFSLGSVLSLNQALLPESKINGIIALSPAYHLSSYRVARWARWVRIAMPWIDRGVADDAMRYEAMPTRGVVETVKAIQTLHKRIGKHGPLNVPWLLAQSVDDAVVLPEKNLALWQANAIHPDSRLIQFYSGKKPKDAHNVVSLSGVDEESRVLGLSHLAIHVSPNNIHYGIQGNYRNCGSTAPRNRVLVKTCQDADSVSYGLWNTEHAADVPMAISTFNPAFERFADELQLFVGKIADSAP